MAWSFVSALVDYDSTTLIKSVTAGNLVIVGVIDQTINDTITISDDNSQTWTRIGSQLTGQGPPVLAFSSSWFYAVASLSTTITVTLSGLGGGHHGPWMAEYSHSSGSIPTDTLVAATQHGQLNDQSGSTSTDGDTSNATTPGVDGCLVVGWIVNVENGSGSGSSIYAPGTSFTERATASDDSHEFEMIWSVEDREQTTSASAAATWTAINVDAYAAHVGFFKPPTGGRLVSASDSVTVSESVSIQFKQRVPSVNDAVAVTEQANIAITPQFVIVNDGVTLAELVTAFWVLPPSVNDGITIVESITIISSNILRPAPFDAVTIVEVVSLTLTILKISVFDTATITESVVLGEPVTILVFDPIAVITATGGGLDVLAFDDFLLTENPLATNWATQAGLSGGLKDNTVFARGSNASVGVVTGSVWTPAFPTEHYSEVHLVSMGGLGGPVARGSSSLIQGYWLRTGGDSPSTWSLLKLTGSGPVWALRPVDTTPSASWTASGLGSFDATKVNDGLTAVKAFDANTAAAGSFLRFDSGAGLTNEFGRVQVVSAGTGANATWDIQHSPDASGWTTVATGFSTGGAATQSVSWNPDGFHRYWRLFKTNAAVSGPDYYEVTWSKLNIASGTWQNALTDTSVVRIEVRGTSTTISPDWTNPPQPPLVLMSTPYIRPTGAIISVASGGDLQAAFNAANPGDIIELQAGATFTGNFNLPNKSGASYIYVQSSLVNNLPEGTRVSPSQVGSMAKIVSTGTAPALSTVLGAHHYRFVGIEIATTFAVTTATNFNLILLEAPSFNVQTSDCPHDIVFDRCYIHGSATGNCRRGILMNGITIGVVECYISDFHEIGADSQALCCTNGPGPFKIVNNYLEGAGENVLFGGADPEIPNLVPSDIEFRNNYCFKPLTWNVDDGAYLGLRWTIKNCFELKNAQRLLIDGNTFDRKWGADGGQLHAIVFTVRNQDGTAPWSVVQDVTFTNNVITHVGGGCAILGSDNNFPSQTTSRILIQNNVWDIDGVAWGGRGDLLQIAGGVDIILDHNTSFQNPTGSNATSILFTTITSTSLPILPIEQVVRMVFTNNICTYGPFGFFGDLGAGSDNAAFAVYAPAIVFRRNAIIGGTATNLPVDNFYPATIAAVGFFDLGLFPDVHLASTSPYVGAGLDGHDVGVSSTPTAVTAILSVFADGTPGTVTSGSLTDATSPIGSGQPGIYSLGDNVLYDSWFGGSVAPASPFIPLGLGAVDILAVSVLESVTMFMSTRISVNDDIALTESVAMTFPPKQNVNDVVTVAELIRVTINTLSPSVFDPVAIGDRPLYIPLATDGFARNENPLSTGWAIQAGVSFGCKAVLALSAAQATDSLALCASVYTGTTFQSDQYSEIELSLSGVTGYATVRGNASATQGYWLSATTTGWTISKLTTGPTLVQLATGTFPNVRAPDPVTSWARFEAAGTTPTTFRVYMNDVLGVLVTGSLTDAVAPYVSGAPGIAIQGDSQLIFTWNGGNIPSFLSSLLSFTVNDSVALTEVTALVRVAAGGGTLAMSVNDAVITADTDLPNLTVYIFVFDNVVLAQSSIPLAVFDTVTVFEVSPNVLLPRLSTVVADLISVTEATGVVGPTTAATVLFANVFDNVVVSFVLEGFFDLITLTESLLMSVATPPISRSISVSDSIVASEFRAAIFSSLSLSAADSLTVAEATAVLFTTNTPVPVNVFESITITDVVASQFKQLVISVNDLVSVNETATLGANNQISVLDTVLTVDAVLNIRLTTLQMTVNELVVTAEDVTIFISPTVVVPALIVEVSDDLQTDDPLFAVVPTLSIEIDEDVAVQSQFILFSGLGATITGEDDVTLTESVALFFNPFYVAASDDVSVLSVVGTIQVNPMKMTTSDTVTVTEYAVFVDNPDFVAGGAIDNEIRERRRRG